MDGNTLACIVGQNPEGELPVQPPVPRLQRLVAQSQQLIALVSDPSKVPFHLTPLAKDEKEMKMHLSEHCTSPEP